MWKAAMDFVAGIFKPAADLIDLEGFATFRNQGEQL